MLPRTFMSLIVAYAWFISIPLLAAIWYTAFIDFLTVSKMLLFCKSNFSFPVANFSKSKILLISLLIRSLSETILLRNRFFVELSIWSSSNKISESALIEVIGVFNSWATVSKKSSFCLSRSFNSLFDSLAFWVSSKIFRTSGKLISSSFTTDEIKILEEGLKVYPGRTN